jgi:ribonuclease D
LNQKQKDLLKRLFLWRFHRAKDENRAVFMFLQDSKLLEFAQDIEHPEKYLSQRKMKVYGVEIEQIIKNG